MSKTLKKFLEVYEPKAGDEKKFKDKHVTVKTKDANGNGDDVFQATNVKMADRQKEAHGYNPGKDEAVYEEVESLEEMDFRTAKELSSKFKNKGDNRKASLYLKLADALKRGDKTTAQGFMSQIKSISEETDVDEMSTKQMKKREDIVKGMKRNLAGFKERYGKDAKSVMYATATKRAMDESAMDDEGKMARGQLMRMVDQASKLAQIMDDYKQLDGWVQSKLTMASKYLDSVHDYLMYNKQDVDNMSEEVEEIDELRDPNRAGVKVGEKVRITNPKAPARHTLDKIKGNTAFITKGDGSKLTTSLDRIKRIKAQSMSNEEVEEIDELKKQTLGNYINKAAIDLTRSGHTLGMTKHFDRTQNQNRKSTEVTLKHIDKRLDGIKAATKKMAKEDVDVSLLQLYMGLDEENQQILVQMFDEGRKDELVEFAQTTLELVDGNDN